MEDEDCLPENSTLKEYLQSLGYQDLQIKKSFPNISSVKLNDVSLKHQSENFSLKGNNIDVIDEQVIKEVEVLISTQLLFEEDVGVVENLLSSFKVKKYGMLRSMFHGMLGLIMFSGLILYLIIGSYAFFITSTYYAYKAADYLWKSNYRQNRLKKLTGVLQTNYNLLTKTVKFINENNRFLDINSSTLDPELSELKAELNFYNSFKSDFYSSLIEVIEILSKSTHKLIINIPLLEYVENPNQYLFNKINDNYCKSLDLLKLYNIYLLTQAEFLLRLILSLIPNLHAKKENNFQIINKILTEANLKLLKITNLLSKKFKFIYVNGVLNFKSQVNVNKLEKKKVYKTKYEDEFACNMHDVSNSFQNLLIKSRILEENLKGNKNPLEIENVLINMEKELNYCQKSISDGFILLKKAMGGISEKEVLQIKENQVETFDNEKKVEIGFTELNSNVDDEIFEAYFLEDNEKSDICDIDDWDVENAMKRKLEREFSKNVMSELKTKLEERDNSWKKREANIIPKRFGILKNQESFNKTYSDEINDNIFDSHKEIFCKEKDNHSNCVSNYDENSQSIPESYVEDRTLKSDSKITKNNSNNRSVQNNYTVSDNELLNYSSEFINKSFLNDINLMRQKIFRTNVTDNEEHFSNSDYSSDEND